MDKPRLRVGDKLKCPTTNARVVRVSKGEEIIVTGIRKDADGDIVVDTVDGDGIAWSWMLDCFVDGGIEK